jgi:hypothetical protein
MDNMISELIKEQEKDLEKLRYKVEELQKQVEEIKNQISNFPNQTTSQSPAPPVKSRFNSSSSSITMVQSNYSSNRGAKLGSVIPQLDVDINSLPQATHTIPFEAQNHPADVPLQCETCHQTFDTEDQFNEHDNAHNYCCDECFIYFTTQVMADLHEPKEHPNTHYVNTYIPQSTKLIFASGQPLQTSNHIFNCQRLTK